MNHSISKKESLYIKLHEKGQRVTSRKKIILDVLLKNTEYMLSATQIIDLMGKGRMDSATVYRILQSFHDAGVIEYSLNPHGVAKYKICDTSPHHHMICTSCGRIINFPCVEKFWDKHLRDNNFIETSHNIEIYGICEECNKKAD